MEKICKITNLYIATLRAIYLIEQNAHWTTRGTGFYGDHLLFQRLYESAQENADLAAEKFLGVFGDEAMDYQSQCEYIDKVLKTYAHLKNQPLKQCLAVEKDFIELAEKSFKAIENAKAMTLGVDDMIMAINSKREESCYLLQQALKTKNAQVQSNPAALPSFLNTALNASVANSAISATFRGELAGNNIYKLYFSPPLNLQQQKKLLDNLSRYIQINRPALAQQITFKFD